VAQGWHAYNITTDKDYGIGDWSDQQIADYLSFGHAAGRGSASGPMGEAVGNSLRYLTADDTHSLVLYLRRVEPQTGVPGTQVDPTPGSMTASSAWAPGATDAQAASSGGELGRRVFEGVCASCHEWNGGGRQTNYAALAGSQAVNDPEGVNLVRVLLSGGDLKTSHGTAYMPSFAGAYNDVELAAVSNYVIGHFGGKAGQVTPELVKERRVQQ
jgi:mono/diheme cytochrome c family protein